jgi:hypothetical protein
MWHKHLRRERGKIKKRFLLQETTSTVVTRHEETSGTALGRNRSFLAPSGRIDCAAAAASLRAHPLAAALRGSPATAQHALAHRYRTEETAGGGRRRASPCLRDGRMSRRRPSREEIRAEPTPPPSRESERKLCDATDLRLRRWESRVAEARPPRRIYAFRRAEEAMGGGRKARSGSGRPPRRVPPPPVATALARADEEAKEDAFLHIDMLVESRRCARRVCREAQGAQRGDQGAGSRLAGELARRRSLQGKVLAAASARACAWPESRLVVVAPCGAGARRAPRLRLAGQRGGGAERRRVCVRARATGAPGSQLVAAPCTPPRVGHRAGARRAKRTAARTPEHYHSLQPARCARSSPLLLAIGRGPCRTLHGWRDFSQRLQERKGERKR